VDADVGDIVRTDDWSRICEFVISPRQLPAALLIEGEAGSGKSTLWQAGVKAAEHAGHQILRSEPSSGESDLSFAGLSDLLAGVLPDVSDTIPAPQLEALEIALLLRPATDHSPTLHAVGLAVLAAIQTCVTQRPVLIAIDDGHWMDQESVSALTFALRRLRTGRLSLLVTARGDDTADPFAAELPPQIHRTRDLIRALPAADAVVLGALDETQIERLLPHDLGPADVARVTQRSGGNPFWARQLAASLQNDDESVPQLALMLSRRLMASLSVAAGEALAVVSAAGRLSVTDALSILDGVVDDPAAALDAAVIAHVLVESGNRLSPAHPLIGAATVAALPPVKRQRQQLYRRLASHADNPERHAHFVVLAAGAGPDPQAAAALDAAAATAAGRAAIAAAGEFASQAVLFTPTSDGSRLDSRRIRAAELQHVAGAFGSALSHLEKLTVWRLPIDELERVLPLLASLLIRERGAEPAREVVRRAVEAAGDDPRRKVLALSLAADADYGNPLERRAAAEEAIRYASEAQLGGSALHRALRQLVQIKLDAGEGLDPHLLAQAESLEADLDLAGILNSADADRAILSKYVEDVDASRAALMRCLARADAQGDDTSTAALNVHLASTEMLAGNHRAARVALEAAAGFEWGSRRPAAMVLIQCQLLIAAGDLDTAMSLVNTQVPDEDQTPERWRWAGYYVRGLILAMRADTPAAIEQWERFLFASEQRGVREPGARIWVDSSLAELYVAVGRLDDAAAISQRLRTLGVRLGRPTLEGMADRLDALVSSERGDAAGAAAAAMRAVSAHEGAPLPLERVRSLLTLGRIERRHKARRSAREALTTAKTIVAAVGHAPLEAAVDDELSRVAAVRSADDLTTTERRVAELIAGGATNREAAALLFVGVRTIETHVASIYRKLGVRTRAEVRRRLPEATSD
jgi:DNA-binding CsgD family transcriptional regulator